MAVGTLPYHFLLVWVVGTTLRAILRADALTAPSQTP